MDYYTCIKSFHILVQEGNFAKAAEFLKVQQSTVSKRIQWLEQEVNFKLLERTTRELVLTEKGKLFLEESKELITRWYNLLKSLDGEANIGSGSIYMSASSAIADFMITDIVHNFLQKYPTICINYSVRNEFINLSKESLDLYITNLHIPTSKLIIREELIAMDAQIVATPEFLAKNGIPRKLADLEKFNCISHQHAKDPSIWKFTNGESIKIQSNLSHNNFSSIIKATKAGLGLSLTPTLYIQKELLANELCIVLPELISQEFKIYAYYIASKHRKDVVSMFLGFLKQQLSILTDGT